MTTSPAEPTSESSRAAKELSRALATALARGDRAAYTVLVTGWLQQVHDRLRAVLLDPAQTAEEKAEWINTTLVASLEPALATAGQLALLTDERVLVQIIREVTGNPGFALDLQPGQLRQAAFRALERAGRRPAGP